MRISRTLLLIAIAAASLPLRASDGELVLVPLWYEGSGAFGSGWTTELSVYNPTSDYVQPSDGGVLPCQWLIDPCPGGFWSKMMIVYHSTQNVAGGFLMRVPDADSMQFALRVFEDSARDEDLGTDVPVVRERDLRSGPVQLMNIPASPQNFDDFRYRVRVWAVGDAPQAFARLNGYVTMGDGSPDLVVTKDVAMTRVAAGLGHYYIEDVDVVASLMMVAGMGQLRIEIEPLTQGLRWWGMVSVTNNRSQDVSIITPR